MNSNIFLFYFFPGLKQTPLHLDQLYLCSWIFQWDLFYCHQYKNKSRLYESKQKHVRPESRSYMNHLQNVELPLNIPQHETWEITKSAELLHKAIWTVFTCSNSCCLIHSEGKPAGFSLNVKENSVIEMHHANILKILTEQVVSWIAY